MAARPLRRLALCAGGAGLELGIDLALEHLGVRARTVGYVEREAFAAATLVARMAEASLDDAPVWDDVTTFDARPWRGVVDLVAAGFSCQPWSSAGKRKGTEDERWIWPDIIRTVRDVGPGIVFLENVPPLAARGGLGIVLGDLAEAGFDAEWGVLSAAEVGATHRRERLFVLAYRHDERCEGERCCCVLDRLGQARRDDADGRCGEAVAYTDCSRGMERRRRAHDEGRSVESAHPGVADDLPLWPPGPGDVAGWISAGEVGPQPSIRRVADGVAYRVDRLHALGNGVVPLVAAVAFVGLARRAGLLEVGVTRTTSSELQSEQSGDSEVR